jgi:hypothetical protein
MDNTNRAKTVQPWLTKQKSHEIFRFTASTVDIPTRWNPRAKQQQRVALADFSAAPWQGFEKSANAAPTTPPCFSRRLRSSLLHWADCLRRYAPPPCSSPFHRANKKEKPAHNVYWFFLVRWKGLEPPAY